MTRGFCSLALALGFLVTPVFAQEGGATAQPQPQIVVQSPVVQQNYTRRAMPTTYQQRAMSYHSHSVNERPRILHENLRLRDQIDPGAIGNNLPGSPHRH